MFQIFLFVGYLRRTSNYPERITLFNMTHMMSAADPEAICEEIPMIDSGRSLEKEFIELIHTNLLMVLVAYDPRRHQGMTLRRRRGRHPRASSPLDR